MWSKVEEESMVDSAEPSFWGTVSSLFSASLRASSSNCLGLRPSKMTLSLLAFSRKVFWSSRILASSIWLRRFWLRAQQLLQGARILRVCSGCVTFVSHGVSGSGGCSSLALIFKDSKLPIVVLGVEEGLLVRLGVRSERRFDSSFREMGQPGDAPTGFV